MIRFVERLDVTAAGKLARDRCVTSSSPAAAAVSVLPLRAGSPPPATTMWSRWRGARANSLRLQPREAQRRLHFRACDLGVTETIPVFAKSVRDEFGRSTASSTMPGSVPTGCWPPCIIPRSRP